MTKMMPGCILYTAFARISDTFSKGHMNSLERSFDRRLLSLSSRLHCEKLEQHTFPLMLLVD